ncbi:Ran-specific GTPase-activating protein 30 [Rhizina undulata]
MEFFLNKVSQQAGTVPSPTPSFALRRHLLNELIMDRSGIIVTSQFAIKQCGRYISSIQGRDRKELQALQDRLETKIQIISPAIDLVEIISARGNTSLDSALTLTKSLRHDMQELGVRLSELTAQGEGKSRRRKRDQSEIKAVMDDIRDLLRKIEDAVPLISLAVTTSGVNISSNIPHNVSPSRLLQASTLLTAGDTAYSLNPFDPAQIGTTFTLSLYMLFAGHSHRQEYVSAKDLTWQEVIYKCRVKLQRVPLFYDEDSGVKEGEGGERGVSHLRAQNKIDEYCYELCLVEDLDDGRVHEVEEGREPPGPYEEVQRAGLRTRIPIHQISKIFYTNSGKLLGIEESNSPILLIKRDQKAPPPRKLLDRVREYEYDEDSDLESDDGNHALDLGEGDPFEEETSHFPDDYELPRHLDPEWLAFEVFTEDNDFDEEEAGDDETSGYSSSKEEMPVPTLGTLPGTSTPPRSGSVRPTNVESAISKLDLGGAEIDSKPRQPFNSMNVKSTLSILEYLLRLTVLQNYQQASHLSVYDELLNLFLSDSTWIGSAENRAVERERAKQRIGFDPYGSPTGGKQKGGGDKGHKTDDKLGSKIYPTGTPKGKGVDSRQSSRRGTPQPIKRSVPVSPPGDRRSGVEEEVKHKHAVG